ncbi:UNVERIFIED_CONTAM: Zeaxanthin epoxidase, chloroplastic [Sesamum angustifolium]|uniref:Zeaxanthin epoxidase, chloroplastic n=2 Tax=Sesamum TaxID=4181 RepID=A0AAW2RIP1_9LAMI
MASLQCPMSLNICPHQPAVRGSSYVDEAKGNEKKLKILVAGGGIAGLVFGLAAKRSGFDVKVFEKDLTAVRGEGRERGPIQLLSSALGLLEAIDKDVAREIMGAGHVTGDRNCGLADGRSGDWFVKFDFLTPAIVKGIPITQMICNGTAEAPVECSWRGCSNQQLQAIRGDLLVGADGLRSTVRSKLFGAHEPNYSNFICYTGVAEFDPQHLPHFGYKVFLGRNQFLVAADIGKGRLQWTVTGLWLSCNLAQAHPMTEITSDDLASAFRRFEKKRMFRVRTVHSICRMASVMTSVYQSYLDIGPLPLFKEWSMRVKHPGLLITNQLLQFALPKFMDWVIAGQE